MDENPVAGSVHAPTFLSDMLTQLADGHGIVMTGAWNIRLFAPEWVAANLAPGSEVGLAVNVGNAALPIRLQFRGVFLRVGAERLILSPVELTDTALQTQQELALRILELLPHTPVGGIGVNFQYRITDPPADYLSVFQLSDTGRLSDYGAGVQTTTLRRTTLINDETVGITMTLNADTSSTIEINNHIGVTDPAARTAALQVPILQRRDRALDLLQRVYQLGL